jgi:hypothetical protein
MLTEDELNWIRQVLGDDYEYDPLKCRYSYDYLLNRINFIIPFFNETQTFRICNPIIF